MNPSILVTFAGALAALATAGSACEQPSSLGREVVPTTRLLVAAPAALLSANPRDDSVRRLGNGCQRGVFSAAGHDYVLSGDGLEGFAPRRAISGAPKSPIALLTPFKKSTTLTPPHNGPPQLDPTTYYAVVTILESQVKVWKVFDGVPDDPTLERAMSDGLWEIGRPLSSFDLAYAGPRSGYATLKSGK